MAESISTMRIPDGRAIKLEYHKSLPSASLLAKEYAAKGYPDRYVIITEEQFTTGILRSKLAPGESEKGIFVSVILRPTLFPSQMGALSPLSATALLTALEKHTDNKLGIGWLSDVYCNGHRIGGVNVEGKLDSFSSFEYLIVTFAVRADEENFPPRLSDMLRQVFEENNETVGIIIAKTIVTKFFEVYRDLKNPDKHAKVYKDRFILGDKKIKYLSEGKKRRCRVIEASTSTFSLICETSSGERITLNSPSLVIIPETIK